jgi:hypothetical protein
MGGKIAMSVMVALFMAGSAGAQEEEKKEKVRHLLGLISCEELKSKCAMDEEQGKKCEAIYAEYKDKFSEAQKKIKDAKDRKEAYKEAQSLKQEVLAKLREVCKDDEQKKKFDEATADKRKKKAPAE